MLNLCGYSTVGDGSLPKFEVLKDEIKDNLGFKKTLVMAPPIQA